MTAVAIFGICAATLIGIGAFGLVTRAHLLRRIVAFNVLGSGVFLMLGALGNRDPARRRRPRAAGLRHHRHRRGARSDGARGRPDRPAVRGDRPGDIAGRDEADGPDRE
jgi:hypothetical protein